MENTDKRIIEINGIKLEVDLRHAKRIDEYRVGDRVKMLKKNYDAYTIHMATIVSFDEFLKLPSIVLAYLDYNGLQFATLNAKTEGIEIAPAYESDLEFSKDEILRKMNSELESQRQKVADLEERKRFFLAHFGKFFIDQKPIPDPEITEAQ